MQWTGMEVVVDPHAMPFPFPTTTTLPPLPGGGWRHFEPHTGEMTCIPCLHTQAEGTHTHTWLHVVAFGGLLLSGRGRGQGLGEKEGGGRLGGMACHACLSLSFPCLLLL